VAFSICAGHAFVNLFNQVAHLSIEGDFEPQPRVKVGFLSNLAQYFYRKIDFASVGAYASGATGARMHWCTSTRATHVR